MLLCPGWKSAKLDHGRSNQTSGSGYSTEKSDVANGGLKKNDGDKKISFPKETLKETALRIRTLSSFFLFYNIY